MIIDFHTHAFTDNIAERAITKLENICIESSYPNAGKAFTRGTVSELVALMRKCGVDRSVLLPVATKPSQQTTINNWAKSVECDEIISFGSVHPDADDWEEQLTEIKKMGLKGIKLHPDYQGFFADEDKVMPIYEKCAELKLPVILHAGYDPLCMDCIHCTPQMSANIIEKIPGLTLILAHFGGNLLWNDVEKYLIGKNVYLDTAFIAGYIQPQQFRRMVDNHGIERVLFASDSPWHSPDSEISLIDSMGFTDREKEFIFYRNALKVLCM